MMGKALNVREVDEELLTKFKILCHEKHISMREAVINLVKLAVSKQVIPKGIE